jgi:hypothetical protein
MLDNEYLDVEQVSSHIVRRGRRVAREQARRPVPSSIIHIISSGVTTSRCKLERASRRVRGRERRAYCRNLSRGSGYEVYI